jgi:Stress responsive A/B Barrel Domain
MKQSNTGSSRLRARRRHALGFLLTLGSACLPFARKAFSKAITDSAAPRTENQEMKQLIHHVFFWLKNPDSKDDLTKLLEGLRSLGKIETVRKLHIGVPADTERRDVVDATYSASELMLFDDTAAQKAYQDHPIHRKFVERYGHLWEKVIVYDSIDV